MTIDAIPREELAGRLTKAVACRAPIAVPGALGPAGAGTAELASGFDARRSIRRYSEHPLTEDEVCSVIVAGLTSDHELWPQEDALRFVVLADRVAPLGSGVYEYTSHLARRMSLTALADHVFQPDLAGAAAVVVVCGDLAAAVSRHGAHGYRRLLTRAGAAVAVAHLAAVRAGLVGCPFDGLLPEAADTAVRDLSLFALALGRLASDTAPNDTPRRD